MRRITSSFSIRTKILFIMSSVLIATFTLMYWVNRHFYLREYRNAILLETSGITQSLRLQLERILNLDLALHDIVGFEQQCRHLVQDYQTITFAYVADSTGQILFHSDLSQQGQRVAVPIHQETETILNEPVVQLVASPPSGMTMYAVSFPTVGPHGDIIAWITTGFPASRISERTQRSLLFSLGMMSFTLIIVWGTQILAVSTWVNTPLSRLLSVMTHIQHHGADSAQFVNLNSRDEVGRLAMAFDAMISEIRRSHKENQEYAQTLEDKVQERTTALYALNTQLTEEIQVRTLTEQQLQASLHEKEVLLKEIHHRVKNNLQVISSLLNLQAPLLRDEHDRLLFQESQQRVKTMAMIHEDLYRSKDLHKISVREYIVRLIREVVSAYGASAALITLDFDVADVQWDLDTAIPCGLIINELVSDVLKYAFPNGSGALTIRLTTPTGGGYELSISDNGVGLPEGFDLDSLESLGLQLVQGLVEEQLGGQLTVSSHPGQGTTWTVRFRSNDQERTNDH